MALTQTDRQADINSIFYLDNTLSYGNGASHRLDKQSLQDAPASLQVRQENKIPTTDYWTIVFYISTRFFSCQLHAVKFKNKKMQENQSLTIAKLVPV